MLSIFTPFAPYGSKSASEALLNAEPAGAQLPQTPKVYETSLGWLIVTVPPLVFMAAIWFFASWRLSQGTDDGSPRAVQIALGIVFGTGGFFFLYEIAELFRFRMILANDFIEVRSITGSRRLARSEISGRTRVPKGFGSARVYPKYILLRSRNLRKRPVYLPIVMKTDQALTAWIGSVPNDDPPVRLTGSFGL